MVALPRKLASTVFGPIPLSRDHAIALSERMAAMTSFTSSFEYLARRGNMREGGLNDWAIGRQAHVRSHPWTRWLLDRIGTEQTTVALHTGRIVASGALLLPVKGKWRGAAGLFLAASNAALYPRHRYGTDGADQVSTLVHATTGAARLSRSNQTRDALLWYVALQSSMSYVVSGWVKLLGSSWRQGTALAGIMRTKTYGFRGMWRFTQDRPVIARSTVHGVLALECLFPLVYLGRGVLVRPIVASAALFHLANGVMMGLGRFVGTFVAMHPMVAYTSAPREHPAIRGRDDRILLTVALAGASAVATSAVLARSRRAHAVQGWAGTRCVTTRQGNGLTCDVRLVEDRAEPVLVFLAGLIATPEHFSWITEKLAAENVHDFMTYSRAGYAGSTRCSAKPYSLQESVDDLVDLVRGIVPDERGVVLVGHSLGGEFARRSAEQLGDRLCGIVYLDSSHPAELHRSTQQENAAPHLRSGLAMFVGSLKLGLGGLLNRPEWVDHLPGGYRAKAYAQYADSRMWESGLREWTATEREFRAFHGALPEVKAHALVVSAEHTVDRDPEHLLMHNELADAHRGSGRVVRTSILEGANHDSMLTQSRHAQEVARRINEFLEEVAQPPADSVSSGCNSEMDARGPSEVADAHAPERGEAS